MCPLTLVLSTSTTEKSLAPFSLFPPIKYLYFPEPSLLLTEESHLSQPVLIGKIFWSLNHLCISTLDSPQYVHVSFLLGNPELYMGLQCGLTNADQEGRIPFLDLMAMLFLMLLRMLLAAFATRASWWFMVSLLSCRTPRSLSAELLSRKLAPKRFLSA